MKEKYKILDDIPTSFWKDLKRQVKTSKGKVVFLVHPFFLENKSGHSKEIYESYKKVVTNTILKSKRPVVILESNPGEIRATLGNEVFQKANLFCLPSMDAKGALVQTHGPNGDQKEAHPNKLISLFEKARITQIAFGGSIAYKAEDYATRQFERKIYPPRLIPGQSSIAHGCAGSVYTKLATSGKFKIIRIMPNAITTQKPSFHKRMVSKGKTNEWIKKMKKLVRRH
jgi:hypothetical protein